MNIEEAQDIRNRAHAALINEAKKRQSNVQEQVTQLLDQSRAIQHEITILEEAQTLLAEKPTLEKVK